jgi:methionyl-tRNA formyltransferase
MGTPRFAVPSLATLIGHGCRIAAVVTAADKPRGRGQVVSPTAIKTVAVEHCIPILQPMFLRDPGFVTSVADFHPDLIVVVAFRILPPEIFNIPRLGSVNLHASLLPKYRGAAPINRAIMAGETETGVTTFMLQQKVDTGGILLQERIAIGPDEDAGAVHDRLSVLGAQLVLETVRRIEAGTITPKPQDDGAATPAPKITRDDCRINWNRPTLDLHNMIRGLSPSPAAFTAHNDRILRVFKAKPLASPPAGEPGYLSAGSDWLHASTADAQLAILELQQEGKKRMGIEEFLRGYRFSTGERLGTSSS